MSSETADILFAQCHIAVRAVSPCRNVWTNVWMHRCWGWCRYCYQAKMPNIALCSTDDVKEVDKSDSNLFIDTVGLEGFLTCCNFLISQIYASFHLEPLVYKEMDTNLNNYRFLWTTKKSSLWPHIFHTARIFQFWWEPSAINIVWQQFEFTRCHGIPIKWASYCSNCEDKKKKKTGAWGVLSALHRIATLRMSVPVTHFESSWLTVIKYTLGARYIIHCVSSARCHAVGVHQKKAFLLSC